MELSIGVIFIKESRGHQTWFHSLPHKLRFSSFFTFLQVQPLHSALPPCLITHFFWTLFLTSHFSLPASSLQFGNSRYAFPIWKSASPDTMFPPGLILSHVPESKDSPPHSILHLLITWLPFSIPQGTFCPSTWPHLTLQITPSLSTTPPLASRTYSPGSLHTSPLCALKFWEPECPINSPLLFPPYTVSWVVSLTVVFSTIISMLTIPQILLSNLALSSDGDWCCHCLLDFLTQVSSQALNIDSSQNNLLVILNCSCFLSSLLSGTVFHPAILISPTS